MSGTGRSAVIKHSIEDYRDMMDHPRPVSGRYPSMSIEKRAAQFSPFKALTGYEDEVEETARYTGERLELSEDRIQELDQQLRDLMHSGLRNPASITYFVPDERKAGGEYRIFTGRIAGVDTYHRRLILADGSRDGKAVAFEDIYAVETV